MQIAQVMTPDEIGQTANNTAQSTSVNQEQKTVPSGKPNHQSPAGNSTQLHPPLYSVLVVCPLKYSRLATVKHIQTILPEHVPSQISARESLMDCKDLLDGENIVVFTHVVLVVRRAQDAIDFMIKLSTLSRYKASSLIIITDAVRKQKMVEIGTAFEEEGQKGKRKLYYVFKPLKPAKLVSIFDPQKERKTNADRKHGKTTEVTTSHQQMFVDMRQRLGNKGYKILLAEDNRVNQMVRHASYYLVLGSTLIRTGAAQVF